MSFTANRTLTEGQKVSLTFTLPGRVSPIQATGKLLAVVDGNRASLRFEEIKAEDREFIREFAAGQPEIKASS